MANSSALPAPTSTRGRRGFGWVTLLDDVFRIPGTNVRFGIDGFLGLLLPGLGDVVTGAASVVLLTVALRERVPTVVLFRMLGNIGVDVLMGLVPGAGDAFDFAWKSSRRNLDLIEQYKRPGARARMRDYVVVGFGLLLAAVSMVMPFVVIYLVLGTEQGQQFFHSWFQHGAFALPWP